MTHKHFLIFNMLYFHLIWKIDYIANDTQHSEKEIPILYQQYEKSYILYQNILQNKIRLLYIFFHQNCINFYIVSFFIKNDEHVT